MKKMILFSLAAAALLAGCAVDDKYYGTYPEDFTPPYNINWVQAADSSTKMVLIDKFWMWEEDAIIDADTYWYFNPTSDKQSRANNGYWPQGHCIDVIVDAYNRTGDEYYKDIMAKWFIGVPKYQYAKDWNPRSYYGGQGPSNNGWWNPFIDDMEWNVLALIRMYDATGIEEYLDVAREIYDNWIITTWSYDENGGGVLWCHTSADPSKNACSNAPAAIIAARLYNITGEDHYLDEAIMIYEWQKAVLFVPETGAINDNISYGKNISTYRSTYNQGTFLGAAHELYKITGRSSYLQEAVKTAEYTMTDLADASGKLLVGAHAADLGLFNGIFIRYFTLLTNETGLDKATRQKFHDYITYQATTVWTKGITKNDPDGYGMLYSGYLDVPGYFIGDFERNCTGCTIVEAMNILEPVK